MNNENVKLSTEPAVTTETQETTETVESVEMVETVETTELLGTVEIVETTETIETAETEETAETVETTGIGNLFENADPSRFISSAKYMGIGMLGIFLVMGILILGTALLNKIMNRKPKDGE